MKSVKNRSRLEFQSLTQEVGSWWSLVNETDTCLSVPTDKDSLAHADNMEAERLLVTYFPAKGEKFEELSFQRILRLPLVLGNTGNTALPN